MNITPETKKKLLYGGGALASIFALVLYMRNKQTAASAPMPSLGAGTSGGGGVSSGTSQNDAAVLNAATALAVEQSRQQSALQIAQLQANTALGIAGIQGSTAQNVANAQTAKAAFGPGGAGTAAAINFPKLVDTVVNAFKKKPGVDQPNNAVNWAQNPLDNMTMPDFGTTGYNLYPESTVPGYYVMAPSGQNNFGFGDFTTYIQGPSNYVEPATYDYSGGVLDLTGNYGSADYFQGTTGTGDSLYFGASPEDSGSNPYPDFTNYVAPPTNYVELP